MSATESGPGKGTPTAWSMPRLRHLDALWRQYLAGDGLPQLDRWTRQAFRGKRQFGKRDRTAYADALFAVARYAGLAVVLEAAFQSRAGAQEIPALRAQARLATESEWKQALQELPSTALFAWAALLNGAQGVCDPASSERQCWWAATMPHLATEDARKLLASLPPQLDDALEDRTRRSGWDAAATRHFLDSLRVRPPVWLRPNHPEDVERLLSALREAGVEAESKGGSLMLTGSVDVRRLDAYREGKLEVQDFASQAVVRALHPLPGELVWDACTGGGGKAIAIAAEMRNSGTVYASDLRTYKLEEVRARARRAGFENIRIFEADATQPQRWEEAITKNGGFDRILVDAPCTGTGTWRRNPDGRWHVNAGAIAELTSLQKRLLDACSASVRAGGFLAYATCSWLPAENEEIVEDFLSRHSEWTCADMAVHGSPHDDADTMFVAMLQRRGA